MYIYIYVYVLLYHFIPTVELFLLNFLTSKLTNNIYFYLYFIIFIVFSLFQDIFIYERHEKFLHVPLYLRLYFCMLAFAHDRSAFDTD